MFTRNLTQALRAQASRRTFTTAPLAFRSAVIPPSTRPSRRSITSTPIVEANPGEPAQYAQNSPTPSLSFFLSLTLLYKLQCRGRHREYASQAPSLGDASAPLVQCTNTFFSTTVVHEYPTEDEFIEGDLGHSMDGPEVDVGKHTRRTLASFSMTNKVSCFSLTRCCCCWVWLARRTTQTSDWLPPACRARNLFSLLHCRS